MIPRRQPAPPPGPITLSKLLLVEGDTPMHFAEALLQHLGLEKVVEIRNFRGVGDFKAYLNNLVVTPDFRQNVRSVSVLRDAEDKLAASARQSIQDSFTAAGLIPTRSPPIRTASYILPDDNNAGMIETLCNSAVSTDASLSDTWLCVQDYFACLSKKGVSLPSSPVIAKNQAQVYLASRQGSQLFPGTAAYHGHWPFTSPVFDPLKNFLRSL
jgi:hypothetical protein